MKKYYKVKPKTKTTEIQKTSTATINEEDTVSTTGANTRTDKKINLSDQSLTEGQTESLKKY